MSGGRHAAVALLLLAGRAAAPATPAQAQVPAAAAGLRVSVITYGGPGAYIWERFGHNMIRITDPGTGSDIAYDWGRFDFNQKNFYWNFLQGRPRYWMDTSDPERALAFYRRMGRSVRIQELSLTPDQARALAANLARNAEPDEKFYQYDYFRDNCSTRVRDALNAALGGVLGATSRTCRPTRPIGRGRPG